MKSQKPTENHICAHGLAVPSEPLDLIWGAANIAKVVNLNPRQTFYQLESGSIPAKKVGGKWVAERNELRAFFLEWVGG